jgi:hypothetical protein
MRRLLVLLLAGAIWLGAYEHRIHFKAGASHIYRGYSSWVEIWHDWSQNEGTFTVDPATDVVTAPGHTLSNGQSVRLTSSGALPGGLTNKLEYYVCDISGDTLRFGYYGGAACDPVGWQVNITDAGTGTHRLGRGMDNGPVPDGAWPTYLLTLSGVPAGVTYEVWCERDLCPAVTTPVVGWYSRNGASFFMLRFTASKTATLGATTITATVNAIGETPDETISFSLTVEDLVPVPSQRPASYPTLPQFATWETSLTSLSLRWCDPTSYATAASSIGPVSSGVESGIWFYDGTWTFRQIARYTGNANWNNCADYLNNWYRDYVLANNGGIAGYKAFSAGIKSSCASCDMRNRVAITLMSSRQAMAGTAGWPWDWTIRETAYLLETYVNYEGVTGTRHSKLLRAAENLLAMFDELFRDGTWTYQHIYWDGLAMRALIQYFDLTGDQRVPRYIKIGLDWIWANAWNDTTKKMVYNPANWGPRCAYGCADTDGWAWTELIGLIIPASGWYYWYSGDDLYRQRGDEWFQALPRWPRFGGTASNDQLTITAHGLSVDDQLNVKTLRGYTLPGGLVSNQNVYVKGVVDADHITVCSTKGGATINLTSDGTGFVGLKCNSGTCRGNYSGKMFSQQYRWSMAYVQWRQGLTPYAP